jgi:hypothetical protein
MRIGMDRFSADERIVLDRLLSEAARRLDGAVDFWTVVCLNSDLVYRQEFVRKNLEELRAFLTVTRALVPARWEEAGPLLKEMSTSCATLGNAFEVLGQFQTAGIEDLRSATNDLIEVYSTWWETIRRFAQASRLDIGYLRERTPEREEYLQSILRRLFDLACSVRATTGPREPASA